MQGLTAIVTTYKGADIIANTLGRLSLAMRSLAWVPSAQTPRYFSGRSSLEVAARSSSQRRAVRASTKAAPRAL